MCIRDSRCPARRRCCARPGGRPWPRRWRHPARGWCARLPPVPVRPGARPVGKARDRGGTIPVSYTHLGRNPQSLAAGDAQAGRTHRSANLRRRPGATTARVRRRATGVSWHWRCMARCRTAAAACRAGSFDCYAVCNDLLPMPAGQGRLSRNILRHLVAAAATATHWPSSGSPVPSRPRQPPHSGPAAATAFPLDSRLVPYDLSLIHIFLLMLAIAQEDCFI